MALLEGKDPMSVLTGSFGGSVRRGGSAGAALTVEFLVGGLELTTLLCDVLQPLVLATRGRPKPKGVMQVEMDVPAEGLEAFIDRLRWFNPALVQITGQRWLTELPEAREGEVA